MGSEMCIRDRCHPRDVAADVPRAARRASKSEEKRDEGEERKRSKPRLRKGRGQQRPAECREREAAGETQGLTMNGLNFSCVSSLVRIRSASSRFSKEPTRTLKRPSLTGAR